MNREITLFILITYFLSFTIAYSLSSTSFSSLGLAFCMPALVSIVLTICNKRKISSLFKGSSVKDLLYGAMIPLVLVPSTLGLSWLFSILVYNTKSLEVFYSLAKVMNIGKEVFMLIMVVYVFVVSIALSIISEISWRGYLLKNMKSKISNFYIRVLSVSLVCGVYFAIMFGINPYLPTYNRYMSLPVICISTFLQSFLCSVIYALLFERSGSIWPGVVAYSLFVILGFSFIFFEVQSFVGLLSLLTAFYFLAVVCILLLDRRVISKSV